MQKQPMTYANQRVISIQKEQCDKSNKYAAINLDALQAAAYNLSPGAFKLWMFFAKNRDGFTAVSSPANAESWSIPKNSYYRYFGELKDLQYIVEDGDGWVFYEMPPSTQNGYGVVPNLGTPSTQNGYSNITNNNTANTTKDNNTRINTTSVLTFPFDDDYNPFEARETTVHTHDRIRW